MTKIEWVKDAKTGEQGRTWNPTVGCTRISEGCRHCYAERMARRLQAMGRPEYQGTVNGNGRWTGTVNLVPERLEEPLRRKKPTTWFVDSMSDLFHENVPFEFVARILDVCADERAERHTFQILTKRPDRMLEFFGWFNDNWYGDSPASIAMEVHSFIPNVWLGVSVESSKQVDRIDQMMRAPAAVYFVSFEPLLDDVVMALRPEYCQINWAIAGGESGPGYRPCKPDWVRALREWSLCWGIPFFFKQWGGMAKIGVAWGGNLLDGRTWNEMPTRHNSSSLLTQVMVNPETAG